MSTSTLTVWNCPDRSLESDFLSLSFVAKARLGLQNEARAEQGLLHKVIGTGSDYNFAFGGACCWTSTASAFDRSLSCLLRIFPLGLFGTTSMKRIPPLNRL